MDIIGLTFVVATLMSHALDTVGSAETSPKGRMQMGEEEARRLVYRALGVPDVIQVEGNRRSAAGRLLRSLSEESSASSLAYDDAYLELLFGIVSSALAAGALDSMFSGSEDASKAAMRLRRTTTIATYIDEDDAETRRIAAILVKLVRFVETHPFVDAGGRYFA